MMAVAAIAAMLLAGGISDAPVAILLTAVTQGGLAALIFISAGGFGYPLVKLLAPKSAPRALLLATACGLGLWLLATAVLVVGATTKGLLNEWLWWPIVGAGVAMAAWQGKDYLNRHRPKPQFGRESLVWVVLAFAMGLALAGNTRPPGLIYSADTYDVQEYHLQAPREFHQAGHIGELQHNSYSYYPLGVEMLFLLCMCLRGGAYEGMYAAQAVHLLFGVLAVAVAFGTLRKADPWRARFTAVLLGTTPMVIYLGWLAMVELALLFYCMLAVLWLREWLRDGDLRTALMIGLAAGGACAAKYTSIGLIAGPILIVMGLMSLPGPGRAKKLSGIPLAATAALLLLSPWLVRNATLTGNPVFPLATEQLGRGHWSAESQQRWLAGHGPQFKPPVPPPPGWQAPQHPQPTRPELLYSNLIASDRFGPITMLLAGAAICVLLAGPKLAGRWGLALAIIIVIQAAVWAAMAHGMPSRFMAPAIAPIVLLAGGVLAKLAGVQANPFRPKSQAQSPVLWGRPIAVALLAAAVVVNLLVGVYAYRSQAARFGPIHGIHGEAIATSQFNEVYDLPAGSKVLLVGESRGFYFPHGTIYATAFDANPLDAIARKLDSGELTPSAARSQLGEMGVTHVWVGWREILRLARSYGYPASLSAEVVDRRRDSRPPALAVLETLGAVEIAQLSPHTLPSATAPANTWPWVTLFALPKSTE